MCLDAGFSCPNADGTLGQGGCIFCNIESFAPVRRMAVPSLRDQWEAQVSRLKRRKIERFIAYLQTGTNTYAPLDVLKRCFDEIQRLPPGIVGVAVGTRPDCVPDPVLDMIAEIRSRLWVSIELGLQSAHDRTLQRINRRHTVADFFDAVRRCRAREIHVGVHVILGLPGETRTEMIQTAERLAGCDYQSLKLHNLYAARNTPLGTAVERGRIRLIERDEYVQAVVDFLERT
ncbi:MAG: TIGR01212 family radical SAM protein, partial [Planctomycetota bacterium]